MVTLAWNPVVVCNDLQKACQILTERCLKLSAKWAAEQWMGLPPDVIAAAAGGSGTLNDGVATTATSSGISTIPEELEWNYNCLNKNNPALYYARTLLELGEYAHAAAVLSQTSLTKAAAVEHGMSPPIPNLTPTALYVRAYALYLAGERRKEEDKLVVTATSHTTSTSTNSTSQVGADGYYPNASAINAGYTQANSQARNPYLQQLSHELLDAYENDQLDAFGLHVYGMVLKQAASTSGPIVLPPDSPSPQSILIQSILLFPYNWSAWLDLADIIVNSTNHQYNNHYASTDETNDDVGDDNAEEQSSSAMHLTSRQVERDIEEYLQPELGGHFMYHFFCAHLQAERQAHADALIIYERWMDPALFQGSPYLLSQFAVCSYHTRQFASAKTLLEDLHNHMPYRLDSMDVYSNILYVQEDSVALSQLAHTAVQVDKYRAETCCIVGNYYSLKQQRAKAIQYFQRALKMDPSFTSAWTLMGHEYVEWKQTANAMQAYRRAVQVAPGDYRAWYGLGQTYELLNMNLYALYYYKQAAQLRPYDARMWCAVGMTYAHLHRYQDAIRAYERALQQDDSEGVATQKLAALYRQQEGYEEKAAACYWRHLEIRHLVTHNSESTVPHHSRATTSGGFVINTDGPESLEKMLQGIFIESTEAEALLYLANYHRTNGEYDMAAVLLEYPGPEKEEAKAMLRELRSRSKPSTISTRASHQQTSSLSRAGRADLFEFSP